LSTQNKIYLRVSSLSHAEFCDKRSKIESFNVLNPFKSDIPTLKSIVYGNKMHEQYNYMNKGFDTSIILGNLEKYLVRGALQKQIDNIVLRGIFDSIRVITVNGKKYSVLLELKTIQKKYLWSREILSGIKQLQLYMYMLKEILEELGYPLWKRGYLEIYSQHTGYMIRRIPVEYDVNIEEWVREVVRKFKGLSRMNVPHYAYCKRCPEQIRSKCDWYYLRSNKNE